MKNILAGKIEQYESKEDKYNYAREFLQELILQIIDRKGYFKNLAFLGGTALRILYDLPRFSEDLDFSLVNNKDFNFKELLIVLKNELELNGFSVEEIKAKDKTVLGEFIRFKGLLYELGLSQHKSEKMFVKLEIDSNPPQGYETEIVLVNKNFMFKVRSYKLDSIFAGKLHALFFRKYDKGRDYYDLLWLLTRRTGINYKLLSMAATQTQKKSFDLNPFKTKALLLTKMDKADFSKVLRDVRPFLEKVEEAEFFTRENFVGAIEKYFSMVV